MKIKECIEEGRNVLNKNNFEDTGIIIKELLCHILNENKQHLVINRDKEINEENYRKFRYSINEIINGKPIQYITNKQEFMGLNFYVNENVLIPQPDTEILVENVLEICNNIKTKEIKILDLCTGSGAIAVSLDFALKNKNTKTEIYASDISELALDVARRNNAQNGTNVKFINSDLFKDIQESDFDIIVSNPPYIKKNIIKTLSRQVQNEPIIALDGGNDGLNFYRDILKQARKFIKNNGFLCLEIGYDQKKEILEILEKYKEYKDINVIQDLSNNDRCITMKKIL